MRGKGTRAVLFDLDGTLADTAADLSRAVNRLRSARGLAHLPLEALRAHASSGARGLIGAGLGISAAHSDYEPLRKAFLEHYENEICIDTRLFPGMLELLSALEARRLRWGIVTNKSSHLTHLLVRALELEARVACVVGGNTTAHLKPHPASLLHAAAELSLAPRQCVYLGDDLRDVQAARAAGMRSVAVGWGYGGDVESWQADAVIGHPLELFAHLDD